MVRALDSSWPVAVPVASALVRWRGPGSALAPFSPASAPMAQKFPLYRTGRDQDVGHSGSTKEMGTHDDAAANRPPVPDLRYAVPLTGGRVHQLVRWQAYRFPRACRGNPAAAVSHSHVRALRLLRIGA